MSARDVPGVVYLIHFDKPIGNLNNKRARAQHYIGWTEDLPARLDCHRTGNGARIMKYLKDHGIGFTLVRYWKNATKRDERKIKNMKCAPALCGCCTKRPRNPPIVHLEEAFKIIDDSIL